MFQLDPTNKRIGKIFLEIRYKEVFSLPEKKYKILDKLTKKYPEYNIDSPDRISLFNPEKRIQIHIHLNRLIIDWDDPTSVGDFIRLAKSVITDIKNILHIETVSRFGLRALLQYKEKNREAIESYILNRFLKSNAIPIEEIADEVFAPRLHFSGRKGKNFFNLAIGHQQEQIIEGNFTGKMNAHVNDFLLVDVDQYRDGNLNINRGLSLLDDFERFLDQKIPEYLRRVEL
jgi:hypothetical protein